MIFLADVIAEIRVSFASTDWESEVTLTDVGVIEFWPSAIGDGFVGVNNMGEKVVGALENGESVAGVKLGVRTVGAVVI